MKIDYIKGIVRFEEYLDDGLFEITLTQNYFKDNKIKNIKTELRKKELNGKMMA